MVSTMNDTIENRTKPNQTKKNNGVRQKKIDRKIFVLPLKCKQTNKFKRAIAEKYFMWTWEQSESNSQIYKKSKKKEREEYAIHTLGRIQRCKRIFIGFMHRFPSVQI